MVYLPLFTFWFTTKINHPCRSRYHAWILWHTIIHNYTWTLQGVPNWWWGVPLSNPLGFKHNQLEGACRPFIFSASTRQAFKEYHSQSLCRLWNLREPTAIPKWFNIFLLLQKKHPLFFSCIPCSNPACFFFSWETWRVALDLGWWITLYLVKDDQVNFQ